MTTNPYQKYKNAQYDTASPEKLLIMLYNGALKFGRQGKEALEEEDIELANNRLKRVQAIINELIVTLDREKGGEIADNLYNLYEYMNRRLIQANIRKDPEIVEEVMVLLREIKEGFEVAVKELKQGRRSNNDSVSI